MRFIAQPESVETNAAFRKFLQESVKKRLSAAHKRRRSDHGNVSRVLLVTIINKSESEARQIK